MLNGNVYLGGNGNGNKFNLRNEILENLLRASGDGSSAKINSLRQAIKQNKCDLADDATQTLDLVRQADVNKEIKRLVERHLEKKFKNVIESLMRNGHDVSEEVLGELACSILDGAKSLFLTTTEPSEKVCISAMSTLKKANICKRSQMNIPNIYESDENESDAASIVSYSSSQLNGISGVLGSTHLNGANNPRKRGRPRKVDVDTGRNGTPIMSGTNPVTSVEAHKWNPSRIIGGETRFLTTAKLNKIMGFGNRGHVFNKYSRMFRYVADDEDKIWLFSRNYSTRMNKKLFLVLLEDALEICFHESTNPQAIVDLQRVSFLLSDGMLQKVRTSMAGPFEQLKGRIIEVPQPQNSARQQTVQQQIQQGTDYFNTAGL